jgi:Icc-related predicted phosphoesterase
MAMTRVFFCTDLHGSEVCFRKFLSAGAVYQANVVIMGGDCTGKMIVPLVHNGNGHYHGEWSGRRVDTDSSEDLAEEERRIRNSGFYPIRMEEETVQELRGDPEKLDKLFSDVMTETLQSWLILAQQRLQGKGLRVILTPGNDDLFEVDDVLQRSPFVEAADGKIVVIDDRHEMLSLSWSNPTPWDTPRECSEEELAAKIHAQADQIQDMENAIFNIHVPPYGTGLDSAPELEEGTKVKRGGTMFKSVGSTAVRDAIMEYQPLLTLHGHIHESRGMQKLGRTVSVNPGSSYSDGVLQGVLIDIENKKVKRYVPVTG